LTLKTKLIVNLTRGDALCVGTLADRPLPRMVGLLGRGGLPAGEGLLLTPAPGIHTAFMRFAIDALFLDSDLYVVDIVERLRPWRVASRRHARAVLELAAGECCRRGVQVGDRLSLRERRPVTETEGPRVWPLSVGSGQSIIWSPSLPYGGDVPPAERLRILVVSEDRHFRSVTTMLLAHRGCVVTTTANSSNLAELAAQDGVDVVVVDTGCSPEAALRAVTTLLNVGKQVGVVIVGEERAAALLERPMLAKWGPFTELFAAIERASDGRETWRRNGAGH